MSLDVLIRDNDMQPDGQLVITVCSPCALCLDSTEPEVSWRLMVLEQEMNERKGVVGGMGERKGDRKQ